MFAVSSFSLYNSQTLLVCSRVSRYFFTSFIDVLQIIMILIEFLDWTLKFHKWYFLPFLTFGRPGNKKYSRHCWKLFPQSHGKNGGMFTYQIINLCWMGKFQGVFGKSSDDLCQVQFNEIPVGVTDIFFVLSSHSLPTLLVAKKVKGQGGHERR